PATGLLARMWELPHVLAAPAAAGKAAGPLADEPAMALLAGSLWAEGFAARPEGLATHAEHVFSHIVWNLQVYKCTEQDQGSEELPLMAAEARAAYDADAQAAAKETAASMLDVTPSASDLVGESVTEAADTAYNSALSQTGKGDGLIYRWIGPKDMDKLAFPNVFLKLLSSYFAGAYDEVKE
ncbi:A/G-specific adenine glycosylase, partial [Paenibacillus illinoisensis]